MAEWEKQIGAINLIVGNLERSKAFYREVFGLPLQHEDEDTAMFRFADTYVFLQRGAAHQDGPSSDVLSLAQKGVGQFVIFVDDADAVGDAGDFRCDRVGHAHPHLRRSGRLHVGDHARTAQGSRLLVGRRSRLRQCSGMSPECPEADLVCCRGDAAWRRLIRSLKSSAATEPSRRCRENSERG